MLLTLLFGFIGIFCLIISKLLDKEIIFKKMHWRKRINNSIVLDVLAFFNIGILFVLLIIIAVEHTCTDTRIQKVLIEQESLERRLELVNSEYEDVSKSEVIKDIAEWNSNIVSERTFANSPWSNWLYNQDVVNVKHIIEY